MKKLILTVIVVGAAAFGAWTLKKHDLSYKQADFWTLSGALVLGTMAGERILKRTPKK